MSKSKQNDNGRYFEFLITKQLHEVHHLQLTERAKNDQILESIATLEKILSHLRGVVERMK